MKKSIVFVAGLALVGFGSLSGRTIQAASSGDCGQVPTHSELKEALTTARGVAN